MGQTDSWRNCTTEDKKIKDFTLNNVVLAELLCIYCGFQGIACEFPVDTETGQPAFLTRLRREGVETPLCWGARTARR